MELLEQCRIWHENDEHQKIIEALEAIPEGERTPEQDLELARAYNNQGDPGTTEGRALFRRAVGLMEPHRAALGEDYSWNFRMGYALYYLDQEERALGYFQKALELHPGDGPQYNTEEEIRFFIDDCRRWIAVQGGGGDRADPGGRGGAGGDVRGGRPATSIKCCPIWRRPFGPGSGRAASPRPRPGPIWRWPCGTPTPATMWTSTSTTTGRRTGCPIRNRRRRQPGAASGTTGTPAP